MTYLDQEQFHHLENLINWNQEHLTGALDDAYELIENIAEKRTLTIEYRYFGLEEDINLNGELQDIEYRKKEMNQEVYEMGINNDSFEYEHYIKLLELQEKYDQLDITLKELEETIRHKED